MIKQFELGKDSRALINELSKSKEITDEYMCYDVEYPTGSRLEYDSLFILLKIIIIALLGRRGRCGCWGLARVGAECMWCRGSILGWWWWLWSRLGRKRGGKIARRRCKLGIGGRRLAEMGGIGWIASWWLCKPRCKGWFFPLWSQLPQL